MGDDPIRPLPFDPSRDDVETYLSMLPADGWMLTVPGDYQSAAVEAMRADGTGYQRLVALSWPARMNHSKVRTDVQLLLSADDAEGLADVLRHTARWLRSAERLSN